MALFPSIRPGCLRVLTLEGSDTLPLRQELESLGLWQRAVMQVSKRDAEGGLAGCWRAHVAAWRASIAACELLMVLEDDAFFDAASLPRCNASFEAAAARGGLLDMFLLGWGGLFQNVTLAPVGRSEPCVYRIWDWASSHAYIIGRPAMRAWRDLEWAAGGITQIDLALSRRYARRGSLTTRPQCAFQRNRNSSTRPGARFALARSLKSQPAMMHSLESDAYKRSNADEPVCRPAAKAESAHRSPPRLERRGNALVLQQRVSGSVGALFSG